MADAAVLHELEYDPVQSSLKRPIVVGSLKSEGKRRLLAFDDDRHITTIAGSRSGKAVSLIFPTLLTYPGSAIVIDPKGEICAVTAKQRKAMGHHIVVLDPFGAAPWAEEFKGKFNPLEFVDIDKRDVVDIAAGLAEAIVVKAPGSKDPHWDEYARIILKGVIMHTLAEYADDATNFATVNHLITLGVPSPLEEHAAAASPAHVFQEMALSDAFEGAVRAVGNIVVGMSDNERSGVMSSIYRQIEFLGSPLIRETLTGKSSFDPRTIRSQATTVYLVLPEARLESHGRWLRLIINSCLSLLQTPRPKDALRSPLLFVLDEFATLGRMEAVERATGYIAGFGVSLWTILQDLTQLKDIYGNRWETFLGNSGLLTAFGNTDNFTLNYLSKRLGETEIMKSTYSSTEGGSEGQTNAGGRFFRAMMTGRAEDALTGNSENKGSTWTRSSQQAPQKTALMTPDEVARHFAREQETILILGAGLNPIIADRIKYYEDDYFKEIASPSPFHEAPSG